MLAEGTRVYDMCNDVVPIVQYEKNKKISCKANILKKECTPKRGIQTSLGKNKSTIVPIKTTKQK